MTALRLHIADRNYSSWSLRPWLALRHGDIDFEDVLHPLPVTPMDGPAFRTVSPTGRVPALEIDGVVVVDSLAICEWAAERAPSLWPEPGIERALARSAAAIMHSGFAAFRAAAPMNIRRRTDASRLPEAALADAREMDTLWRSWLQRSGGPFLFGQWSIADAMYAPAATRFVTYAVERSADSDRYIAALMEDGPMKDWVALAEQEGRSLERYETA
jgi:glutathione S-transferase